MKILGKSFIYIGTFLILYFAFGFVIFYLPIFFDYLNSYDGHSLSKKLPILGDHFENILNWPILLLVFLMGYWAFIPVALYFIISSFVARSLVFKLYGLNKNTKSK